MDNVSITFSGLCGFASRSDTKTDALCHPEAGAHTPVLTVPIKYVSVAKNKDKNSWQPNFVGHAENGDEIGVWDLRGQDITLGDTSVEQSWIGVARGLRMTDFHGAGKPASDADARAIVLPVNKPGALFQLFGGAFQFLSSPTTRVEVTQGGNTKRPTDYSTAVRWQGHLDEGDSYLRTATGLELALRLSEGPIAMAVTNVSREPSPEGLAHFIEYYALMSGVAAGDYISLTFAGADTDVYDCVPPVDLG